MSTALSDRKFASTPHTINIVVISCVVSLIICKTLYTEHLLVAQPNKLVTPQSFNLKISNKVGFVVRGEKK